LDKFKSKPEPLADAKKEESKIPSEYFYSFGKNLTTLSNLNKKLEEIYMRLNEIL
jgi:hypothetical protein